MYLFAIAMLLPSIAMAQPAPCRDASVQFVRDGFLGPLRIDSSGNTVIVKRRFLLADHEIKAGIIKTLACAIADERRTNLPAVYLIEPYRGAIVGEFDGSALRMR
jgi:hypothetical protein